MVVGLRDRGCVSVELIARAPAFPCLVTPESRRRAWRLLTEYTKSESLLKHALAVEAAVRGYARKFGEDEDGWGIVALLHDFDYERWPSLEIIRSAAARSCASAAIRNG